MSKYDPLRKHLQNIAPEKTDATLTFRRIEEILDASLPRSASAHQAWWSNEYRDTSHVQCHAWIGAGWEVDTVDRTAKWVRFRRMT
jgi:hypothetical protein